MLRLVNPDGELVIRKARKAHRCEARQNTYPRPERSEFCKGTINPGDTYLEYLAATFQSGTHYCEECAPTAWMGYVEHVNDSKRPASTPDSGGRWISEDGAVMDGNLEADSRARL